MLKYSLPRVKMKMTGSRVLLKLASGVGGSGGVSSLAELNDTTIAEPADGQVLAYNATTGMWENKAASGTGDMLKSEYDSNDDGKVDSADSADAAPWSGITGKPETFTPEEHTHDDRYYTETETDTLLSGKSDTDHTHDSRYYTETEIDTQMLGKSDTTHTHSDLHSHSNKAVLDATTASYTTTEETKLAGIAEESNKYVHPDTHSADIITDGTTNKVYTATEKTKLGTIDESANNYTLPTASDSVLGGVKVGARLSISDGVLSADEQSGSSFTDDQEAAITGAASPSSTNVFATMNDVSASGSDDKKVKASSTDANPGYLDAKVDDATIEVSSDKLQVKSGVYSASDHNHSGIYEPVISTKNTAFNKNFGSIADTVCEGNDSRLSDSRTPTSHTHTVSEVTDFDPSTKSDTGHGHAISDVTNLQTSLDGKSDTSHNHDDRYYTETEADNLLSAKSDTGHTHDTRYYTEDEADTLLSGKSDTTHNHDTAYLGINATATNANKLDNYPASSFVLTADYEDLDVLAKVKAVDGANSGLDADLLDGQHVSDIVNSPALTGTPTAPTAPVGTSTTQIATTEFVNAVLDANIYARNSLPSIKGTSVAADRYTWQSPAGGLVVGINGTVYALTTQTEIDLSNAANWDTATPDYTVASARAGKDFYVYACEPASGNTPDIVLSASSTYPSGYTADNSRKISGFHCVCANIGTITGHPLSGFVAGDILPLSVWDLRHRPKTASPEGMVWSEAANIWVDIYLQSGTGATTASAYGATITDTRTWMDHVDDLAAVNKRLLDDGEFQKIAAGGNEETNIAGSADPGTTGGHNDTSGRRMVSSIGCEDCAGVMYQWLSDQSYRYSRTTSFAWVDLPGGKGDIYIQGSTADVKLRAGGSWGSGASCGSRCRLADICRWHSYSDGGARGAAEPA